MKLKTEHIIKQVLTSDSISQIGLRSLLVAFSLVAILMSIISVTGLFLSQRIQNDLDLIVNKQSQHIVHLQKMQSLAKQRTLLIYEITLLDDAFERDQKMQEFYSAGSDFLALRSNLLNEQPSHKEKELLAQQENLAKQSSELILQALSMMMEGKQIGAIKKLQLDALPAQKKMIKIIDELVLLNRTERAQTATFAAERSQKQQRILAIGSVLAILLTLAIGWRVWYLMRGLIGGLQNTHRKLLDSVRTMEYQQIAMNEHAIVSITDPAGNIISVNPKFCEISQYSETELIGQNHHIDNSDYHPREFFQTLWQTISNGKVWQGTIRNRRKDGSFYWVASTIVPFLDDQGKPYQYVAMRTDITPLISAKEEAELANKAKSHFLSSMSHELRTPLNAILGFSQLMTLDRELAEKHKDAAKEIIYAGEHLLKLINEVLDLAKIESGKIEITLSPVSVSETIESCLSLVRTLAEKRAIKIHYDQNTALAVHADSTRLKQALLNLISNAIKYNIEGGSITIALNTDNTDNVRISIIDTGRGIPPECIHELFQPFNRLGAENGAIEGTGIGLNITRRIIEMMGGKVGVESSVNVGSTFWIELPREHQIDEQSQIAFPTESPMQPEQLSETQSCVLYIEDSPANIKLIQTILAQRQQITLHTAQAPVLGIELAHTHKPDLILLDINLPEMNGFQVLEIFKNDDSLKHIPVIAVTANAMPEEIAHGLSAGFDAYLTKPIDIQRLHTLLNTYLNN